MVEDPCRLCLISHCVRDSEIILSLARLRQFGKLDGTLEAEIGIRTGSPKYFWEEAIWDSRSVYERTGELYTHSVLWYRAGILSAKDSRDTAIGPSAGLTTIFERNSRIGPFRWVTANCSWASRI